MKKGKFDRKLLILAGLVLAAVLLVMLLPEADAPGTRPAASGPQETMGPARTEPVQTGTGDPAAEATEPSREQQTQTEPELTEPEQTEPEQTAPAVTPQDPVVLPQGLLIEQTGRYAGMYVEDGSGEIVDDVMMVVLRNGSKQDLQLARIRLTYGDREYTFECTNLPAGEAAVLLDRERRAAAAGAPDSSEIYDVAFFREPMEAEHPALELSGGRGTIGVTNTSDRDLDGDIYIYYKYYSAGYYYGGITFRIRLRDGIEAGQTQQLIAGHYTPEGCRIVQITDGT